MLSVLGFTAPHIDYHALAPEIIIATTLIVVLLVDLASERNRALLGTIAGIGLLAAMVPILTLAVDGTDRFVLAGNPSYVVDNFALLFKVFFLSCVIVAGVYGALTVQRGILFVQALLAALALAAVLLAGS